MTESLFFGQVSVRDFALDFVRPTLAGRMGRKALSIDRNEPASPRDVVLEE